MTEQFLVRFWGTRGSYPVPGPHTIRFGGNTTCVEVQVGATHVIIDAGTGIINLGREMMQRTKQSGGGPITATVLLTHMHHDHTQGFPYFLPAYVGTSVLYILGPRTFEEDLEEILNHAVLPPSFPISLHEMPSLKIVRSLYETEAIYYEPGSSEPCIYNVYRDQPALGPDHVVIKIHKSYAHPRNGVYIYRIEWRGRALVFASDTEGYADSDQRLVSFAQGADLLIHDAQFTRKDYQSKQGWGHSTPEMACDVARLAGARRLVLTHHEPHYDDAALAAIEQAAQQLFADTVVAYEGLTIVL